MNTKKNKNEIDALSKTKIINKTIKRTIEVDEITCPIPFSSIDIEENDSEKKILLGHGSGGQMTHQLIEKIFLPAFENDLLSGLHDGAVFQVGNESLAFTTDSYVVSPIEFPGGDIGSLAVNGTINDLAMCGAKPLYLSCGLILEEGFAIKKLKKIIDSMREAAKSSNVLFVTGDTKVVEKGKGDGIYINTSGVGMLQQNISISPKKIAKGDVIIVSGDIGRHGMCIMSAREGLEFDNPIISDTRELYSLVESLLNEKLDIHCLRDLTRGGLATSLVELSESSATTFLIKEKNIPVCAEVKGACEILGIDPLYVANEGRMVIFLPENQAQDALRVLQAHGKNASAKIIGTVVGLDKDMGRAILQNDMGSERFLDRLPMDQLPRIC